MYRDKISAQKKKTGIEATSFFTYSNAGSSDG